MIISYVYSFFSLLNVVAWVQSQDSSCSICYGQRTTAGGFFLSTSVSSVDSCSTKYSISPIYHPGLVQWAIYSLILEDSSLLAPQEFKEKELKANIHISAPSCWMGYTISFQEWQYKCWVLKFILHSSYKKWDCAWSTDSLWSIKNPLLRKYGHNNLSSSILSCLFYFLHPSKFTALKSSGF